MTSAEFSQGRSFLNLNNFILLKRFQFRMLEFWRGSRIHNTIHFDILKLKINMRIYDIV